MKKSKKRTLLCIILAMALWFGFLTPLSAAENTTGLMLGVNTNTYIEDGSQKTAVTKSVVKNSITWVPLRLATSYLGKTVTFNPGDGTATISDETTGDWMTFDSKTKIATTNQGSVTLQDTPFIQNQSYMVPVRTLSEYFNASVYWDQGTKGVLILKPLSTEDQQKTQGLLMRVNSNFYFENGVGTVSPNPVVAINGTSYLPLRIVSEYLGATADWNPQDGSAILTMEGTDKWLTLNQKSNVVQTNEGSFTVERSPFTQNDYYMVPVRVISEFFGASIEWNQGYFSFLITEEKPDEAALTAGLAPMKNLLDNVALLSAVRNTVQTATASYGKSGKGRDLTYTTLQKSNYSKTVMLVFAQHGFEDNYARDGQVLVNLANNVINRMQQNSSALDDCRLIVVSSANPDGIAEGYTNNGPGRCTVVGGVDMNRDWPTKNYTPRSNARNKTTRALSCAETQNLYHLILKERPNIVLDIHGWLNTTYGDAQIGRFFKNNLSLSSLPYTFELSDAQMKAADEKGISYAAADNYASGYLMRWAQEQGMRSALIELKSPTSTNLTSFVNAVEKCMNL